jgi:hypothetical protein
MVADSTLACKELPDSAACRRFAGEDPVVSRVTRTVALGAALAMAQPSVAHASWDVSSASEVVDMGLGALGLIVAAVLLVETLRLRKLALGGAIAEGIGYVLLATVCLAASALAEWATNFVVDLTLEEIKLASKVLVIVAMALMAGYFWTVRSGMNSYLRGATAAQPAEDQDPGAEGGEGDSA